MMYWKLAIQNIRRSLRDYIIYFVTLCLYNRLFCRCDRESNGDYSSS